MANIAATSIVRRRLDERASIQPSLTSDSWQSAGCERVEKAAAFKRNYSAGRASNRAPSEPLDAASVSELSNQHS
jgi:hypothetical protein